MQKSCLALATLFVLCSLALCFSSIRAASYTIEIADSQQYYAPGNPFMGTVIVRFDAVLPEDAALEASVDGSSPDYLYTQPYAEGTPYQFRSYLFSYNIVANGKNEWHEYPERQFLYRIKAEGTCGDDACAFSGTCECPPGCTPPYCPWTITYLDTESTVKADDGLKFIFDSTSVISPPTSANPDIIWSELINSQTYPYGVQTTMRKACGNMDYAGHLTDQKGWIKMTLQNFEDINGTYWKRVVMEPFDQASLTTDRQKFISADCSQPYVCGGIYKDATLLVSGTDYTANGTSGELIIKNYNPLSLYSMVYLPPNGPYLCAYTTYSTLNSTAWTKSVLQSGYVSYTSPFSKTYTSVQLPYAFNETSRGFINPPQCPYYAADCIQTASSYSASIVSDPTAGNIKVSFSSQSRTVTGTLLSPEIGGRLLMINLSDFAGLAAPDSLGEHELTVSLKSAGSELARDEVIFYGCEDNDGDGFCSQSGDCNDTSPYVHPGAQELCNGMDDNCDGQADEDFMAAGSRLGAECGTGLCSGVWICSLDKKNVTCSSRYKPGQQLEICGNGLDDDCDGVADELYEMGAKGVPIRGCFCKDGDRKVCGSDVGTCSPGYQICIKGDWSRCLDTTDPSEEVCNGKDDNCNGVIDDVGGGGSVAASGCGCYGGAYPSSEECDGIDNDCNGLMDDGMQCCRAGQIRKCGMDKGFCKSGVQVCDKNGNWETECRGEVRPENGNCNDPVWACQNGKQDIGEEGVDCGGMCSEPCGLPYNLILIAAGVALIIATVLFLRMRSNA
jgi:hypothetical protein